MSKMTGAPRYLSFHNWDLAEVTLLLYLFLFLTALFGGILPVFAEPVGSLLGCREGTGLDFCFPFPAHAERAERPTSIFILCDHVTKLLQGLSIFQVSSRLVSNIVGALRMRMSG